MILKLLLMKMNCVKGAVLENNAENHLELENSIQQKQEN